MFLAIVALVLARDVVEKVAQSAPAPIALGFSMLLGGTATALLLADPNSGAIAEFVVSASIAVLGLTFAYRDDTDVRTALSYFVGFALGIVTFIALFGANSLN
jgi:hypothetical protein